MVEPTTLQLIAGITPSGLLAFTLWLFVEKVIPIVIICIIGYKLFPYVKKYLGED